MKNIFTKHPNSLNETYFQHMKVALKMSISMFYAALACFIHAFLPFTFINTAGGKIYKLVKCLKENGRWESLGKKFG